MPCESCGHLLGVKRDEDGNFVPGILYCPRCSGELLEHESRIDLKIDWILEEHLTDENVINVLTTFRKRDLIFYLTWRLNEAATELFDTASMKFPEVSVVMYILKQVYGRTDFGNDTIDDPEDPPERIEDIVDGYTTVLRAVRDVRHDFLFCIGRPERHLNWKGEKFMEDYELRETEYNLCFERCIRSVVGARQQNREDFEFVADNLRLANKTSVDEISSPREYADCWYQIIMSMKLVASADELAMDVFYTEMPASVDIFQIRDFINRLVDLSESDQALYSGEPSLYELQPELVEQVGRTQFGEDWPETKRKLIFSETTLDAHPLLFFLEYSVLQSTSGIGTPIEVPRSGVILPPKFADILTYQIFPLLQNGDGKSGHEILTELTAERGRNFERRIYQYIRENDIECYYGAEITRKNKNEIDLIMLRDEKLWFVEIKFFMPTTAILTAEGIQEINQKFDFKIFKENNESQYSSPSGKTYPEKVNSWKELESGESFTSLVGEEGQERIEQTVGEKWDQLETEMLVVSNLVPSYAEKEEVRFLTDVEFYKLIERDEDVFPEIQQPVSS